MQQNIKAQTSLNDHINHTLLKSEIKRFLNENFECGKDTKPRYFTNIYTINLTLNTRYDKKLVFCVDE